MGLPARIAAPLEAAAVAAGVMGVAFLGWRLATPTECAWLGPDPNEWLSDGVRPPVTAECALRPGSTVTGALLPRGSIGQYVVGGAGLTLATGAYFALPVWQILLSRQMAARPAAARLSEVVA